MNRIVACLASIPLVWGWG